MHKIKLDKVIGILGKRGTGKTTLAKFFVSRIAKKCPVYVFDIVHNWNDKDYVQLGNMQYKPEFLYQNHVFVKKRENRDDFINFCSDILSLYKYQLGKLHCYVVFDEIYLYVNNSNLDSYENEPFKQLLIIGRNYGIGIIAVSQRPAILNKTILSQANEIYTYRLYLNQDLDAIEDYFPRDKVSALKDFHFLGYFPDENDKLQEYKPVKET